MARFWAAQRSARLAGPEVVSCLVLASQWSMSAHVQCSKACQTHSPQINCSPTVMQGWLRGPKLQDSSRARRREASQGLSQLWRRPSGSAAANAFGSVLHVPVSCQRRLTNRQEGLALGRQAAGILQVQGSFLMPDRALGGSDPRNCIVC